MKMAKMYLIQKLYKSVLVHCKIVNNDYQQDSRVIYIFACNKSFGQLLDISPKTFIFLKTFNIKFSSQRVRYKISKLLQMKDKLNVTLVIN